MTFCQNCGAQLAPGAPACPRCGKPSASAQTAAASPQPYQQPHPVYPGPPERPAYQPYQQPPAYSPYPYPAYQPLPAQPGTNTFAILSFVMAWLPIPFAGIVLGIIGLVQCGKTGQKGRGLAIAGILLRVLSAVLLIAGVVLLAVYGSESGGYSPEDWGWNGEFSFTIFTTLM